MSAATEDGFEGRGGSGAAEPLTAALAILTFHALDDAGSVISFSPRVFQQGMAMLHAHGYRTMRLEDAVGMLRDGRPFPKRAFVLTFDDGFESVFREAFPVLQRYGMSGTVFLTVGAASGGSPARLPEFEGRAMLSWSGIREMQAAGMEFGAHTLTHPDLTGLSSERVALEMSASKERIENALGTAVTSFAYPFGRYNVESRRMAGQYFSCACADTLGLLSGRSDPYALERVDAYYLRTHRLFGLMVRETFPWYIVARSIPRRLRRTVQKRLRT